MTEDKEGNSEHEEKRAHDNDTDTTTVLVRSAAVPVADAISKRVRNKRSVAEPALAGRWRIHSSLCSVISNSRVELLLPPNAYNRTM